MRRNAITQRFNEDLKQWRTGIELFLKTQLDPIDRQAPILDIGLGDSTSIIWNMGFANLKILDKSTHHPGKSPAPFILGNILDVNTLKDVPKQKYITCCEVFEHTETPFSAAQNLLDLLTDDGIMFVTVPCMLGWHPGQPFYGDYWRFMPSGLKALFPSAKVIESHYPHENDVYPLGICAVVRKN